jgi:hypothetical protein
MKRGVGFVLHGHLGVDYAQSRGGKRWGYTNAAVRDRWDFRSPGGGLGLNGGLQVPRLAYRVSDFGCARMFVGGDTDDMGT